MLDARLKPWIDPAVNMAAGLAARLGVTANALTWTGFITGMAAVPLLALNKPLAALAAIAINRILDGLDGAVARRNGTTALGGYLDILLDFIFYSAVPFGFALLDPQANGLAAAFLIFSFVGTGASFLAFAATAAGKGLQTTRYGPKSLYYLGGLTEGTETIALLVVICMWPGAFVPAAWIFGMLCWLTTASRITAAYRHFREVQTPDESAAGQQ